MPDSTRYAVTYTAHDGAVVTTLRIVWTSHAQVQAHAAALREIPSISGVTVEATP